MAKKVFTVGYQLDNAYGKTSNPLIRLGGAWLKDFGFDVGDRLELVKGKNMIVLIKVKQAGL